MTTLSPTQQRIRDRTESLIRLAAPALDLVLAVGDRISRVAEPTDHEYYPVRPPGEAALPDDLDRTHGDRRGRGDEAGPPTAG